MATSVQSLLTALQPLAPEQVRLADPLGTVAGVQPHIVVEPTDEETLAAVLAFADGEGLKVLVRGGGTQLSMGFPPVGGDILLSTMRMNQIVEHAPHDQTVTVQAGVTLADLQAALQQTRQWLALDPVRASTATIGGIVSTNATGARRLRYGGVRDQILGVRVVLPDGTVAKGGGKVVKNVAGYDLPKLFTGALGTLGIVSAATFRLYPLAVASRTVLLSASSFAPLCELALRITSSVLVPSALDVMPALDDPEMYLLAVRFEMGSDASAEDQVASLRTLAGASPASVRSISGSDEETFWRACDLRLVGASEPTRSVVLKTSVLPSGVTRWLDALVGMAADLNLEMQWRAHAGHGQVFTRLVGDDAGLIAAIATLRNVAGEEHGSLVVQHAPVAIASQVDMWGTSSAFELMRRIKLRFDPHSTLNPGRFIGGL